MKRSPEAPARSGTQSIERALLLLRELAARGTRGWGLRDLASHCALDAGTVHRILSCLVDEGMVQQRTTDKRYLLGPRNFELGASVPNRMGLTDAARTAVRQFARKSPRVTASAVLRSGDDCVCIARAGIASFTSVASAIREGQRVPLLSRLSGMAIVAALPFEQGQAIFARSRPRLAHFGEHFFDQALTIVQSSHHRGHTLSTGELLYGVNSLAITFGPADDPIGSLAISAWSNDYTAEALKAKLPQLQAVATAIAAYAPSP